MLLEKELEDALVKQFKAIPTLGNVQFITSRQELSHTQDLSDTVVAIVAGWRQNDAFSLSPITVPISITIASRVENDMNGSKHTHICEELMNKLSYWHKFGNAMATALTNEKFLAGELRMDGGQSLGYNSGTKTWRDNIQISIRGSEIF